VRRTATHYYSRRFGDLEGNREKTQLPRVKRHLSVGFACCRSPVVLSSEWRCICVFLSARSPFSLLGHRFMEHRARIQSILLSLLLACGPLALSRAFSEDAQGTASLVLQGRTRTINAGQAVVHEQELRWNPTKTAVIICDMWDQHWCKGATDRVGEMAPRMNEVISRLRSQGALIIHCPSDTMNFYRDAPQRKLAQAAPHVPLKPLTSGWCPLGGGKEPALPFVNLSDRCDCEPQCAHSHPWRRQIALLEIKDEDAITDNFEAFYLMKQRGIENVIVMGVHTNICVLRRPFSIRQMAAQGQSLVLVRDMTDALKDSQSPPEGLNHFQATDMILEHIETYWCPTVTSDQIIGGKPFRFAGDTRTNL
jgi:nicotinamidase-related amidase